MTRAPLLLLAFALLSGGCGSDEPMTVFLDAGTLRVDAGTPYPEYDPPYISADCAESTAEGLDLDADGFPNGVDCDDCNPLINPGAYDEPGNGDDEDCDGADATAVTSCDADLAMAASNPIDAARAIGICQLATDDDWGLISAQFVRVDGVSAPTSFSQAGIVPDFGVEVPFEGASMLALSSGVARAPDQDGFTTGCDYFDVYSDATHSVPDADELPAGFTVPAFTSSCGAVITGGVYNSIALELEIKVPTNARGFTFRSNFFTYEFPNYICSPFNDFYVALRQRDDLGDTWENVVYDSDGNFISVNNGLLRACEAGRAGGKSFACELGRDPLEGTGFDSTNECGQLATYAASGESGLALEVGASTGWLRTRAPVLPGTTLRLRFAIWDSGDGILDSLALIDGFEWEIVPVTAVTEPEVI